MILIGGENKTPQHLPIGSLKLFGSNPHNEPIWRVVWSESRFYLVGAKHVTYDESAGGASLDATITQRGKDPNQVREETGYRWTPLYPGKACWVLELWKSPMGFTGCTPEQYEIQYRDPVTGLLTLGPYPSRGEYCAAHFFSETPGFDEVCRQIQYRRAGWSYTYNDHAAANREDLEKKEKQKYTRMVDIFLDAQQAFKNRATNIRPGKRTKDAIKIRRSAQELGLRQRPGFATGSPKRG